MRSIAAVLTALWAGSLCTICGIVAPGLFATFADRHLAGDAAAYFFRIAAALGAVIGMVLLFLVLTGRLKLARGWGVGLVVASAALPVLSELALGPLMEAARAAGQMGRFGMLHGVAAVFFFAACAGTLALVVLVNRAAE